VLRLNSFTYQYSDNTDTEHRNIGFMTQDVLPYFPELVYTRYDRETKKPFYTLKYSCMSVVAIKAIQEQQVIIDDLKAKLDLLENRLSALEKK
jgi:trimeric autotransporter adhesin